MKKETKKETTDGKKVIEGFLALSNLCFKFAMYLGKLLFKFVIFLGDIFEKKYSQKNVNKVNKKKKSKK